MPIQSYNDFVNAGVCGGPTDETIDEEVREEDAVLDEPIIGKKPTTKTPGVTPLPMPREMIPAQLREHMITHIPYHEGCPYCLAGRRPNTPHRRCSHNRRVPLITADYGFLRSRDESVVLFWHYVYIRGKAPTRACQSLQRLPFQGPWLYHSCNGASGGQDEQRRSAHGLAHVLCSSRTGVGARGRNLTFECPGSCLSLRA